MNLYLIKRGPRPDIHKMPYHEVVIFATKKVAQWEAGNSSDLAWVWTREGHSDNGYSWLLERWNGLDISYGVVHDFALPDGIHAAFWHENKPWPQGILGLLSVAVWWSSKPMPAWLVARGVMFAPD